MSDETCEAEVQELETLNNEAAEYVKIPCPPRQFLIDNIVDNVRRLINAIRDNGCARDKDDLEEIENSRQALEYYKRRSANWTK